MHCRRCLKPFEPRTANQEYCRLACFAAHRRHRKGTPTIKRIRGRGSRELMRQVGYWL